jgi:hypothetical protein
VAGKILLGNDVKVRIYGICGRQSFAYPVTASDTTSTVKFDTDKLPPILNALETDNGGNRLILEVAVRHKKRNKPHVGHQLIGITATFGRECRQNNCYGW